MPDIDIDFSDHRRDEVIDYVRQKYGEEHVAQIITFGTYGARSILRELFKTMDIDERDAHFILSKIPSLADQSIVMESYRSEEHTSELQSRGHLVCRLLLENKNTPSSA